MRPGRIAPLLLCIPLWVGCSARYAGHFGEPVHPGDPGLHLSIGLGAATSDVIVGGAMLGILAAGAGYSAAPPMKPDRRINEQDCTQPIVDPTANLRCR